MAYAFAPRTDGERATCIAAVARIHKLALAPVLTKLIDDVYAPALAAYELARSTNDGAAIAAAKANDDKNAAEALFKEAFTKWVTSAYVIGGEKAVLHDLKPLLGDVPPSKFLTRKVRTRLECMPRVLAATDQAHLAGDPARLAALRAATSALEAAVTAEEAARNAHSTASAALKPATAAFDRAYGNLVRSTRQVDPAAATHIPTFARPSKKAAKPKPTSAAAEPSTETPPSTE